MFKIFKEIFSLNLISFTDGFLYISILNLIFTTNSLYFSYPTLISLNIFFLTFVGIIFNILLPNFGKELPLRTIIFLLFILKILVFVGMFYFQNIINSLALYAVYAIILSLKSILTPLLNANFREYPSLIAHNFKNPNTATSITVGLIPLMFLLGISVGGILVNNLNYALFILFIINLIPVIILINKKYFTLNIKHRSRKIERNFLFFFKNKVFLWILINTYIFYFLYGLFEIALPLIINDNNNTMAKLGYFWFFYFIANIVALLISNFIISRIKLSLLIVGIMFLWGILTIFVPSVIDNNFLYVIAFIMGLIFPNYSIASNHIIEHAGADEKFYYFKVWSAILVTPVALGGFMLNFLAINYIMVSSGLLIVAMSIVGYMYQAKIKNCNF